MRFSTIRYMEWVKTSLPEPGSNEIKLATSGMPSSAATIKELGLSLQNAPITGANEYGFNDVKEAIAARYDRDIDEVFYAQGTSMSNFVLYATLIEPGMKIAVETPVYECLQAPIEALGADIIPLHRHEESGWRLTVDDIRKVVEQGVQGIVMTSPHNPTGVVTSDEELLAFAREIAPDAWLLVDEVYREWIPGKYKTTLGNNEPNLYTTSSLTKVFGFGDLRAGWAIVPPELAKRMYRTYDHMGVITPFLSDWVAAKVLANDDYLNTVHANTMRVTNEGHAEANRFLSSEVGQKIQAVMPDSGGFAFWKIPGMDGEELYQRLRAEQGVMVVPGKFFGDPDCFRISWTGGVERFKEGLSRFERFLS